MNKYPMVGVVTRSITDTITLYVEAEDEQSAYDLARKALQKFPDPHPEDGILRCYIDNRVYGEADLADLRIAVEDESAV